MGEAATAVEGGILSHLEALEASAHQAALAEGELRQHEEKAAWMKARIQQLRKKRDELRAKLDMCHPGATGISEEALLEWKIENARGLLQSFYLTGLSGALTARGVSLRISTAFEGTYLDSFYLDLALQQPVQILRHSVPVFIPLEELAREHLQTDIKRFLALLSDHLNAYVGRKFQADQLEEHFAAFLEGRLWSNSLFNVLEFKYGLGEDSKAFPFKAKLIYKDPLRLLPTEVTVACEEDSPDSLMETAKVHSTLFSEKPLHKVFRAFAASEELLESPGFSA
uniref:Centromere protein O n=1 Tax=Salvator merianae TaxID=96440 RepID=A0A8D0C572_SALMN